MPQFLFSAFRWKALCVLLVALGAVAPLGCTGGEPSATNSPTAATVAETRSITHVMGMTQVPANPQRVVVLTNEATDNVLELGIEPVGAVQSWSGDPYFAYLESEMQGVPTVGDELQPNLEKIAALQPDLIIGSKVRHESIYRQLSAIAPTVYSETLGADWKENLQLYGKALNREQAAADILQDWNQRVAKLRSQLGDQLQQEVSVVRFLPGTARINYEDNFAGRILKEIGFQRPLAQRKDEFADEVTYEQIPLMDGDVLFYMTFESEDDDLSQQAQTWTQHPLWQNLKAVQNDRVYEVNDIYWNTAGGVQAAFRMLEDLERVFLQSDESKSRAN